MAGGAAKFPGRLLTADGETLSVNVQLSDDRLGLRSGSTWFGSWGLEEVAVERLSLFRFRLTVEGEDFVLVPEDPTEFAKASEAFVDLRTTPRFGLGERLRTSGVDRQTSAR